jgi:hypothetical protein
MNPKKKKLLKAMGKSWKSNCQKKKKKVQAAALMPVMDPEVNAGHVSQIVANRG